MENNKERNQDYLFFSIGAVLLFAVCANIYWWITLSLNDTKEFDAVKAEYLRSFPNMLQNALLLTVISIAMLIIAIICFSKAKKSFKLTSRILIIVSAILIFWESFSLM